MSKLFLDRALASPGPGISRVDRTSASAERSGDRLTDPIDL